jgi:hypothetical protein
MVLMLFCVVHQLLHICHGYFCSSNTVMSFFTAPWYMMMPHCRAYMAWALWASDMYYYSTFVLVGVIATILLPVVTDWVAHNTFLNLRLTPPEY